MIGFLSRKEMLAVIGEPGITWFSQRDHLLLALLYNTGARVSEIIGIRVADVVLDGAAFVHLHGKGRKQRAAPLWRSTVLEIRAWLRLNVQMTADSALLPNRNGQTMTRSNVELRLDLAVQSASKLNASLINRNISPHTIRHTTAMHLLQSGVDISVVALWLGHESPMTTHMYVEADLSMKALALARLQEPEAEQASELPVKKGLQKPPSAHEPLGSLAIRKLPLLSYGLGGSQRQQALHYQDNDQSAIDKAKNAFWSGAFQDIDLEQRFPVLENQLHLPAEAVNCADGFHGPQSSRDIGDEKRVLEEFQIRQADAAAFPFGGLDRRLLPLPINVGRQPVDDQPDRNTVLLAEEHIEFHGLAAIAKTVDMLDQLDRLVCVSRQVDIDVEA